VLDPSRLGYQLRSSLKWQRRDDNTAYGAHVTYAECQGCDILLLERTCRVAADLYHQEVLAILPDRFGVNLPLRSALAFESLLPFDLAYA
jgi:hypothetical protein